MTLVNSSDEDWSSAYSIIELLYQGVNVQYKPINYYDDH